MGGGRGGAGGGGGGGGVKMTENIDFFSRCTFNEGNIIGNILAGSRDMHFQAKVDQNGKKSHFNTPGRSSSQIFRQHILEIWLLRTLWDVVGHGRPNMGRSVVHVRPF